MKIEEASSIMPKHESENISLSEKKIQMYYKEKPKIFSTKNIIYIILALIAVIILASCIIFFIYKKNSPKGIENEDFRLSIFTAENKKKFSMIDFDEPKKKKKKNKKNYEYGMYLDEEDREILKDLLEKYKKRKALKNITLINREEIDDNYENNKEEKLFDDENNEEFNNAKEEFVFKRKNNKDIKDGLFEENKKEEEIRDKPKELENISKKKIFDDEEKNEEKGKQKDNKAKIFDKKEEGNNEEIEIIKHKNHLDMRKIKENDNNIFKKNEDIKRNKKIKNKKV